MMGMMPWWLTGPEEDPEEQRRRMQMDTLGAPPQDPTMFEPETPTTRVLPSVEVAGEGNRPMDQILSQYRDWLSQRPTREAYEPGTGRKIAAGLLGFLGGLQNPEAGYKITRGILDKPYDEAVEDWQQEGKGLGEVGKLAQDMSETGRKRASDVMSFMTAEERNAAARAATDQRERAENLRHADRVAAAKTNEDKAAEDERHNKAMEEIDQTRNSIAGRLAGAREKTADAYAQRVTDLGEGKGTQKKIGSYSDMNEALNDSLQEMEAQYPDLEKYFDIKDNPQTGLKTYVPKTGLAPVDQMRMEAMLKDAKARARKKLEGLWGVEDLPDTEMPPGMRAEVP